MADSATKPQRKGLPDHKARAMAESSALFAKLRGLLLDSPNKITALPGIDISAMGDTFLAEVLDDLQRACFFEAFFGEKLCASKQLALRVLLQAVEAADSTNPQKVVVGENG